jgi:DNA-directed RNA polymerase subunit omega
VERFFEPSSDPGSPIQASGDTMIDALNSDEIVNKFGGRFKLTALIQRRLGELIDGARPLIERDGRSDLEVVIEEIMQNKISIDWEASGLEEPKVAKR